MGRRPSKPNAIPRLRARKKPSGAVWYYYDHGGTPRRETPLGRDYGLAIKRWAELERAGSGPVAAVITFRYVSDRYLAEVAPFKAERTQQDNRAELRWLLDFFDDPPVPLEAIQPVHVRQYLTWRTAKVRANREKALLSHIWNFARDKGYTALPNPCAGIKGNREDGRDAYIETDQFEAIHAKAAPSLRDYMDLAYLTGQRPADVMRMDERHLRDGHLEVQQGKTIRGKTRGKLRIVVSAELARVIERIKARKRELKVYSTRLVVAESGRPVGLHAMNLRFRDACTAAGVDGLQMRDIRARAATDRADDSGDIRQAQALLGHTTVTMTEAYVRTRRGAKVTPTR